MSVADQAVEKQKQDAQVASARKNEAKVAIFQLKNPQGSGFIKEDTIGTPNPIELMFPGIRRLHTTSAYLKNKGTAKEERVVIRHIASERTIEAEKQRNPELSNGVNDGIEFKNGRLIVVDEGRSRMKYAFMQKDSRNATNPDRLPDADEVYEEIFPEKEKEVNIAGIIDRQEAEQYVKDKFILSRSKEGFRYDEEKLDAYCHLFNIAAESPASKIQGLFTMAATYPGEFLRKARSYEETVYLEISQAERLCIIEFGATQCGYMNKNKLLVTYSAALSDGDKKQKLASYLQSSAGAVDYKEFKIELEDRIGQSVK